MRPGGGAGKPGTGARGRVRDPRLGAPAVSSRVRDRTPPGMTHKGQGRAPAGADSARYERLGGRVCAIGGWIRIRAPAIEDMFLDMFLRAGRSAGLCAARANDFALAAPARSATPPLSPAADGRSAHSRP